MVMSELYVRNQLESMPLFVSIEPTGGVRTLDPPREDDNHEQPLA